jgi:hypothetical protein
MSESSLRHWRNKRGISTKLYSGIDKNGKDIGHVSAYTKKEAIDELRKKGLKPKRVIQT